MNVHGGVAAGEFQIFKYAPLAARSGRYQSYDSPPDQYHRNCISTNTVLFTDPADPKDRGDQNTRRGLKSDHRTWADWLSIRERSGHDVAEILDWQVNDKEARCRADLTRTNPQSKCKAWIREFVWLGGAHLIVFDCIRTARPEIRRRWQLHMPATPSIGDHTITVSNRPQKLKWADKNLDPGEREGRLICRTLLPEEYTVILHADGTAKRFNARGEAAGSAEGNPYHLKYGSNVIQLDPGTQTVDTIFLHVLTALDSAVSTAPRASFKRVSDDRIEVTVGDMSTSLEVQRRDAGSGNKLR
jgi:hypothetical protein